MSNPAWSRNPQDESLGLPSYGRVSDNTASGAATAAGNGLAWRNIRAQTP